MRKRDVAGGLAVLLVLIAVIVLVPAVLVFGVLAAAKYLTRH